MRHFSNFDAKGSFLFASLFLLFLQDESVHVDLDGTQRGRFSLRHFFHFFCRTKVSMLILTVRAVLVSEMTVHSESNEGLTSDSGVTYQGVDSIVSSL